MVKKDPTVFVDSYGKIHCWCPYANVIPSFENWLAEEGCDINVHGFPVRLI